MIILIVFLISSGCPYGDSADWCQNYISSNKAACQQAYYQTQCCGSCLALASTVAVTTTTTTTAIPSTTQAQTSTATIFQFVAVSIYLSIGINVRFAAMMADVGDGLL